MEYNFLTNLESCYYGISDFIYYSHIPVSFISLFIGFFVFSKSKKTLISRLLLIISILFSIWIISNLIVWVSPNSVLVSFVWSFFGILTALLFLSSIYFTYVYVTKKDVSIWIKSIWLILLLPLILFIKQYYSSFDYDYCEVIENSTYTYYYYFLGLISLIWIIIFSIYQYNREKNIQDKKQILFLSIGISSFLVFFNTAGFFASYFGNFVLEEIGLFGMVIFMAYLAFLIVRFKAFDIKLIGAQALVWQ